MFTAPLTLALSLAAGAPAPYVPEAPPGAAVLKLRHPGPDRAANEELLRLHAGLLQQQAGGMAPRRYEVWARTPGLERARPGVRLRGPLRVELREGRFLVVSREGAAPREQAALVNAAVTAYQKQARAWARQQVAELTRMKEMYTARLQMLEEEVRVLAGGGRVVGMDIDEYRKRIRAMTEQYDREIRRLRPVAEGPARVVVVRRAYAGK